MSDMDPFLWTVTALSALTMLVALVRGVNQSGLALAQVLVDDRRKSAEKREAETAQAIADGDAAALEPLLLNADGSVAEPIIGIVEK